MRIAVFITRYPYTDNLNNGVFFKRYQCGGAEIAAFCLANELAKKGHEIKVFTTSPDLKTHIVRSGNIEAYHYPTIYKLGKGNFSVGLFLKPLNFEVDIAHVHFTTPPGDMAGVGYGEMKKSPVVLTYHGDGQENYGSIGRRLGVFFYNRFVLDWILSSVDVVISPSRYYIEESRFLSHYREKIIVIPNGVDLEKFNVSLSKYECRERLQLTMNKRIILFTGALIAYKGPEILLKAMPGILKRVPDAMAVFVGDGPMRKELEELCRKLNVERFVKFTGYVEESLKPLYYKAADVFCLPSVMTGEVFPLVLLEASASGLPLVLSDLRTFGCILKSDYNGIITRRGDKENLAEAISYLLENEDERMRMGRNARKRAEAYSWEKVAEMTERAYRMLL